MHFLSLVCALHEPPLLSFLIPSARYLVRCSDYEAPHYVIVFNPLLFPLSKIQIFSLVTCSQNPIYVPSSERETKLHSHAQQTKLWCFSVFQTVRLEEETERQKDSELKTSKIPRNLVYFKLFRECNLIVYFVLK
jgi:hypothetical protein